MSIHERAVSIMSRLIDRSKRCVGRIPAMWTDSCLFLSLPSRCRRATSFELACRLRYACLASSEFWIDDRGKPGLLLGAAQTGKVRRAARQAMVARERCMSGGWYSRGSRLEAVGGWMSPRDRWKSVLAVGGSITCSQGENGESCAHSIESSMGGVHPLRDPSSVRSAERQRNYDV